MPHFHYLQIYVFLTLFKRILDADNENYQQLLITRKCLKSPKKCLKLSFCVFLFFGKIEFT